MSVGAAVVHRVICRSFYDQARHAVEVTAQSDNKVTLNVIKEQMGSLIYDITSMKFEVCRPLSCCHSC
jgi:hypothetical protein